MLSTTLSSILVILVGFYSFELFGSKLDGENANLEFTSCQLDSKMKINLEIPDTLKLVDSLINSTFNDSKVYTWLYGDLNCDAMSDFLVISTTTCTEDKALDQSSQCYSAHIFIQDKLGHFIYSRSNSEVIPCSNCERSMPVIASLKHGFEIKYFFGSCVKTVISDQYFFDLKLDEWILTERESFTSYCDSVVNENEIFIKHQAKETAVDFGVQMF